MNFELKARSRELSAEEYVSREEEKLRITREAARERTRFAHELLASLIMRAHQSQSIEVKNSATAERLNTLRRLLVETVGQPTKGR
ncbi:MAG: hypothetical protein WCD76_16935 [Pyrinomonadaceae bacterium]